MKAINNFTKLGLLACTLSLGILGCKKDKLVFPNQVEKEGEIPSIDRGPVKQNNLTVITLEDELVRFDLANVDKEKVKTLYFSYNNEGQKVTKEVTSFEGEYIIKNLSLEQATEIDVWAMGINNLESNKYTYKVLPKISYARVAVKNVLLKEVLDGITLSLKNEAGFSIKLFYKIDNSPTFTTLDVPSQSEPSEFFIKVEPGAKHNITYYIEGNSIISDEVNKVFDVVEYVNVSRAGIATDVSSVKDGLVGDNLIDGDANTYWQSEPNSDYSEHWVDLYLDSFKPISGISLLRRKDNDKGSFTAFRVEYFSEEKGDYVFVDGEFSFNSLDKPASFQRYVFETINTNYIRIYFAKPIDNSISTAELAEINLLEIKK